MLRLSITLTAVWIVGLVTAVPVAVYALLFVAPRAYDVPLLAFVIGWVFFYWPIVGPALMAWRVWRLMRALDAATSGAQVEALLRSGESEEIAVDFIATEHGLPRWLARRIYRALARRLDERRAARPGRA